jgi:polar amino acid transport system substrate-binding protein
LPVLAEENLPFSYRQGQIQGYCTAVVRAALEAARLPYQMDIQPWARIYTTTLAKPGTLMFPVARTAEREDKFRWIGPLVANRIACSAKRPS